MSARFLPLAAIFALLTLGAGSAPAADRLIPLSSDAICAKCTGYLLPGQLVQNPHSRYRVDSDLPEIFLTNGVLYTTRPVLPAFEMLDGEEVPLSMRTQREIGFQGLNDSVEVFLYHLSRGTEEGETRRVVVLVENTGEVDALVSPRQIFIAGPMSAHVGGAESILGERLFLKDFDTPIEPLEVPAGEAAIIGYTVQLNADADGPDTSTAQFVNGTLRAEVEPLDSGSGERPTLQLTVLAIPGGLQGAEMLPAALELRDTGARSGESYIDLATPPTDCHVRRVVGTAYNMMWKSDPVSIDVSALPAAGADFPIALPANQTVGCEEARQTVDLLLHPLYVHPDSIGNYQMEYLVHFTLTNSGTSAAPVDLRFGKEDARIGLVWQVEAGEELLDYDEIFTRPVELNWAGRGALTEGLEPPRYELSFLPDGPVEVPPGGEKHVTLRFLILGTSSLPFDLIVTAGE